MRRGGMSQELDPLGGDAGISGQTQIPDEGLLLSQGSSYNSANPGMTYSRDGIRVPADDFMAFAGLEFRDTLGLVEAYATQRARPGIPPGIIPDWSTEVKEQIDLDVALLAGKGLPDLLALLPQFSLAKQLSPQNPRRDSTLTTSEIKQLRTDVATLLKDPDCAKFVQGVLMQIEAVTGTAAYSSNILDIFEKVKSQGGFGRRAGPFTAEAGNGVGGGTAFMNINYSIAANSSRIFNSASSGRTVIHELLQVASNSALTISHFQMASAAYAATGRKGTAPTTDGTKDEADRRNSNYFDKKLFDACHVRK